MRPLFLAVALVSVTSRLLAQDYGADKPPPAKSVSVPLTAGQKAALEAVDARLAGLEALAAKRMMQRGSQFPNLECVESGVR